MRWTGRRWKSTATKARSRRRAPLRPPPGGSAPSQRPTDRMMAHTCSWRGTCPIDGAGVAQCARRFVLFALRERSGRRPLGSASATAGQGALVETLPSDPRPLELPFCHWVRASTTVLRIAQLDVQSDGRGSRPTPLADRGRRRNDRGGTVVAARMLDGSAVLEADGPMQPADRVRRWPSGRSAHADHATSGSAEVPLPGLPCLRWSARWGRVLRASAASHSPWQVPRAGFAGVAESGRSASAGRLLAWHGPRSRSGEPRRRSPRQGRQPRGLRQRGFPSTGLSIRRTRR